MLHVLEHMPGMYKKSKLIFGRFQIVNFFLFFLFKIWHEHRKKDLMKQCLEGNDIWFYEVMNKRFACALLHKKQMHSEKE